MNAYQSFLLCIHDGQTNVYHNGLPIGVIRDGGFIVHKHRLPDGKEAAVKIETGLKGLVLSRVNLLPEDSDE